MPMETQSFHKKLWNPKIRVIIVQVQLAMSTILRTDFWETPRESILGPMLRQDRLQKNSSGCLVRSDELPGSRQTSVDRTTDCVTKSEPRDRQ